MNVILKHWRIAVPLLVVIAAGLWWGVHRWQRQWAPSRDEFPTQGIAVSSALGRIDWAGVRIADVDFAYIRATDGEGRRDPQFSENWEGARAHGLRYGAELDFSLCRSAVDQATQFITTVPRDAGALPPVVGLDINESCPRRPTAEAVYSELDTLLNLIEAHDGKPAILRLTADFEERFGLAERINRTLWLERDWFKPRYTVKPWVMWTASRSRRIPGVDAPVAWVVVPQ